MTSALSSTQGAFPRSLLTSIALHAGAFACGALVLVPSLLPDMGRRAPADLKIAERPDVRPATAPVEPTSEVDAPELPEPELHRVRPEWTEAELAATQPQFALPPDPADALARVAVSVFARPAVEDPAEEEPPSPEPVAEAQAPDTAPPAASEPVTVAARLTERPEPPYPPMSVRLGEAGTVRCRLFVAADGYVTKVELVRSSGYARLDASALATLATWRFAPATTGGVAHATTVEHDVEFRMES